MIRPPPRSALFPYTTLFRSTQTFTIAVTDQAPSTPTDSDGATGGSVSEGASNGATVGITAASTDVNGGTVTFSLTDDANGRFTINSSTGVVTGLDATQLNFQREPPRTHPDSSP